MTAHWPGRFKKQLSFHAWAKVSALVNNLLTKRDRSFRWKKTNKQNKQNKKQEGCKSFHFYQKQRKSVTTGAVSSTLSPPSLPNRESQSQCPLTTTVARQCRGISGVTKEPGLANHHLRLHTAKTVLSSRRNTAPPRLNKNIKYWPWKRKTSKQTQWFKWKNSFLYTGPAC